MTVDPGVITPGLINRIKNILLTPQEEWNRIADEPADVPKIYVDYVLPLAVLAALCGFIGMTVFGLMGVHRGLEQGLIDAVVRVVCTLIGVFLVAFITNALAPTFSSQQDIGQAHKLAAYGWTGTLIGGLFSLVPLLGILGGLAGLVYSFVLFYIGLPRLMKTPEDKRIGYFVTILIAAIVVFFVIGYIAAASQKLMPG
jgi:hypothetical protein